jgi:hypothetical protein
MVLYTAMALYYTAGVEGRCCCSSNIILNRRFSLLFSISVKYFEVRTQWTWLPRAAYVSHLYGTWTVPITTALLLRLTLTLRSRAT